MKPAEHILLQAVVTLKSSDPVAWANFMTALEARAVELRDQCVAAPKDILEITQGRAQAMRDLVKLLKDAPELARRLGL
jgi:hypothetical protein